MNCEVWGFGGLGVWGAEEGGEEGCFGGEAALCANASPTPPFGVLTAFREMQHTRPFHVNNRKPKTHAPPPAILTCMPSSIPASAQLRMASSMTTAAQIMMGIGPYSCCMAVAWDGHGLLVQGCEAGVTAVACAAAGREGNGVRGNGRRRSAAAPNQPARARLPQEDEPLGRHLLLQLVQAVHQQQRLRLCARIRFSRGRAKGGRRPSAGARIWGRGAPRRAQARAAAAAGGRRCCCIFQDCEVTDRAGSAAASPGERRGKPKERKSNYPSQVASCPPHRRC